MIGAWVADKFWVVVTDPERRPMLLFIIVAGIRAPALTGAIDLYLRARTP